jgi:hypothetical protein
VSILHTDIQYLDTESDPNLDPTQKGLVPTGLGPVTLATKNDHLHSLYISGLHYTV